MSDTVRTCVALRPNGWCLAKTSPTRPGTSRGKRCSKACDGNPPSGHGFTRRQRRFTPGPTRRQ
eukprot:847353-Prorocentrum_lima.AAC.1